MISGSWILWDVYNCTYESMKGFEVKGKILKTEQEKTDKYTPLVAETISNEHQWTLKNFEIKKKVI